MSWGNRYKLPWNQLRADQIDAAAGEVLRRWPEMRLERGPSSEQHVSLYFHVANPLARQLAAYLEGERSLDALWATNDYDGTTPLPIEIEFDYYKAEPEYELEERVLLSFDTAHSGNYLGAGIAVEITGLMGKFFGVECEPS
jgi:hypothetical protein